MDFQSALSILLAQQVSNVNWERLECLLGYVFSFFVAEFPPLFPSSKVGVCNRWTGLLDWTTGLAIELKFNHKNQFYSSRKLSHGQQLPCDLGPLSC